MNAEAKRRRQKAVIGIVAAVVIAVLFTVTIGIGMNNGDTGNGVVGMGGPGGTLTAYGVEDDATAREDVMLHGLIMVGDQQGNVVIFDDEIVIYEGTSGFFLTIGAQPGSDPINVVYYVDGNEETRRRLWEGQYTTLSYGYGKGELKRVQLDPGLISGGKNYDAIYWIT